MDEKQSNGVISVEAILDCLGLVSLDREAYDIDHLSGGLTNDNIRIALRTSSVTAQDDSRTQYDTLVVRRFRTSVSEYLGYDRLVEYKNAQCVFEAGIGPAVIKQVSADGDQHGGALIVSYIQGDTLTVEDVRSMCRSDAKIGPFVDVIRHLHRDCAPFANTFTPSEARLTYEKEVIRLTGAAVSWPGYDDVVGLLEPLQRRLNELQEPLVPCHCDLLAGNFILEKQTNKLFLIDFELSGMATASWELGNIVSENELDDDEEAIERLAQHYWSACVPKAEHDHSWVRGRVARIRAWSIVSKLTWSAWGHVLHSLGYRQNTSSEFDYAAWSMERLQKAQRILQDPTVIRSLLQELQPDKLDFK